MQEFSAPSLSSRKEDKPKRDVHAFGTRSSRSSSIISSIRSAGCQFMKSESREMTSRTAKVVAKPVRSNSAHLSGSARSVFRLVELGQDRLDASQEVQAGVGQRYRPRGPDEQRYADFALQRRDRSGRGRLGNVSARDQPRKSSLAGDPSEQPQREEAVAHKRGWITESHSG